MKILNFLKPPRQKTLTPIDFASNSCNLIPQRRTSFVDYLIGRQLYNLAAYQSLQYYAICDVLYDAVDRIVVKLAEIPVLVYDNNEKAFTEDKNSIAAEISNLLKSPSYSMPTYSDFISAITIFYIVTGNAYYIVNSINENAAPQSVEVIHPQNVVPVLSNAEEILYYMVTIKGREIQYNRKIDIKRNKIVYFANLNSSYSELYNVKKFNPNVGEFKTIGFSQLTPLYYRLEQTLAIARHNLSLLKRGTTLSGVFMCDHSLSDDNLQRFQAMINEYFSGENSAGKPFVMDNAEGWEYTNSDNKQKDMDFNELEGNLTTAIYNNLKIPLPKTKTETMTLSNMGDSSQALYDDAIFPILDVILANLTQNLVNRFDNAENLELSYDARSIPALETRNIENMAKLKEMNVLTDNEIRESLNYPILEDGADDLYQPSTLVPYAR